MKKLIFSLMALTLALAASHEARAQWAVIDPTNLVQNILTVTKTGATATNVVKSFQEMQKIYNQGKDYYDKLKGVHNLIKDARKVSETVAMVSEISRIYSTGFNKMLSDPNFTLDELESIAGGYAILLQQSGYLLAETKMLVSSSNGLSMTDAERMTLIDGIHSKMRDYRNLTRYFSDKVISVSFLRSRDKSDLARVRSLYGEPSERYW